MDSEYRSAMAYALKRLSMQSQPSIELRRKLKERLVSEEIIEKVIAELERLGYLNDKEWIESFVRSKMSRNLGPQAIAAKLQAKGIPFDKAKEFINLMDNGDLQKQRIHKLLETKYKSRDLSDFHTKEKTIASLIRKGFSLSNILDVIKK